MMITPNGKATAELQDLASVEQRQETTALLEILALGNLQIESGRVTPVRQAFAQVVERLTQSPTAPSRPKKSPLGNTEKLSRRV